MGQKKKKKNLKVLTRKVLMKNLKRTTDLKSKGGLFKIGLRMQDSCPLSASSFIDFI